LNPIEEQRKLIDQLYHLVHKSSEDGFSIILLLKMMVVVL